MEAGFGMGIPAFGALSAVLAVLCAAVFAVTVAAGVRRWNRNGRAPRLTVPAQVTARRARAVPGAREAVGRPGTAYYVTFQLAGGDRVELQVPGTEYGTLAEGDRGRITLRDGRYVSFVRD